MAESISFPATVARVKTLADGGIRIELDLPETEVMSAAQLMECKRAGAALKVTVEVFLHNKVEQDNAQTTVDKGPKRKPEWTPPEGASHRIAN